MIKCLRHRLKACATEILFCLLLLCGLLAAGAWAQRVTPGPSERPNSALEAALKETVPLTTAMREDDHPAVASHNGKIWVVWVSYSETEGTSEIYLRSHENGKWSDPLPVSETPGDYHKPAIAVDENSTVWVAWPAQVRGNWDIYGRVYRDGAWSKTERWTSHPGPDMAPQLAASRGRVLLVWQGMRRNNLDILYRMHETEWGNEAFVTENPANDWDPVVAVSKSGAFHVAWDSYRGDYDVFLRTLTSNGWTAEIPIAASPRLENHASLSVDERDRLWIAWEAGPEKWASDSANSGLRPRRDISIACWQNGKLYRSAEVESALAGLQAPALFADGDGRLRLFFRQPINKNWLAVGTTVWEAGGWTKPEVVPYSEGRIDQRIVLAGVGNRVLAVYPAGSSHNVIYAKFYNAGSQAALQTATVPAQAKEPPAQPARHSLNGYQLVWGDLHRHTDISEDGGIDDGSLSDAMRYALDAAGLDFIGITDHTRYLPRRYNLWRIQQISDLYYHPGAFSPMHAYERSQFSPFGHRNIVQINRDYVPVPASYDIGDPGVSPDGLFAALRGQALRGNRAMSIPHTSAWSNKQVSWDYNDPDIERVVEIYQGLRSTYEYNGAPDPANRAVYEKDSKNFVWNALERKLKLGFIASSDHRSTHMSFAAVYAKNIDRESIFEGLQARRTYAATDKILIDFSISDHLMGEEIEISGQPELHVAIEGTAPLAQIDIIKDGKFIYTTKPGTIKTQFRFRDQDPGAENYYYVRVMQEDKNMAWASPIWVRRKN